jgi:hypothetical protein
LRGRGGAGQQRSHDRNKQHPHVVAETNAVHNSSLFAGSGHET